MASTEMEVSLRECRENYVRDLVSLFISSLETQGFELNEVIDAVANHTYLNTVSVDALYFLTKASISLRK